MLHLGPNPVKEPECITVPVPLPQKVSVPAVPAPVLQHWKKANFFSRHFLLLFKKDEEQKKKLSSYLGKRFWARFTVPADLSHGGLERKFHIRMK
jgi:hypothetical protein